MSHKKTSLFLLLCSSAAYAKSHTPVIETPVNDQPTVSVGGDLNDAIYKRSVAQSSSDTADHLTLDSSVRIFFPSQFELSNQYFRVPYARNTKTITGFTVSPQITIANLNDANINAFASIGYAYAQGIYDVQSTDGLDVKDAIELQWIPIQAGIEVLSHAYTSQRVAFGAFTSAGVDWYTQSGQLDGANQTFWLPRYEVGAKVQFFTPSRREAGFGGLQLATAYYRSFASSQTHRGLAVNLGARYAF